MIPSSPKVSLDDLTPHQLVSEIRQISEQYQAEVSTKRRTWPSSLRERVLALARLGVSNRKISQLTDVPYRTVRYWCKGTRSVGRPKRGHFLALPAAVAGKQQGQTPATVPSVSSAAPATVAVTAVAAAPILSGIVVSLPGGWEVRGLTELGQVIELYCACSAATAGERSR